MANNDLVNGSRLNYAIGKILDLLSRKAGTDEVEVIVTSTLSDALADAPSITMVDEILTIKNEDNSQYMSATNAGMVVLDGSKVMSITSDTVQFAGDTDGKVTGLGLPTDEGDATNKQYVDSLITGVTTAGTGAAYTATVVGVTSLVAGVSFTMVPHVKSTSTTPTLNVNGLGAKTIKRQTSDVSSTLADGRAPYWLAVNEPVRVIYDGTYWVVQGMTQPVAADISGVVAVSKGGTGFSSIADTYYSTARYRASALVSAETDPTTNGVINWLYE